MWLNRHVYEEMCARISSLESQLEAERRDNRLAERHWANSLLRSKNSFPIEAKPNGKPATPKQRPQPADWIDPGELEAHIAEGARHGIDRASVIRMLRDERGLPPLI